VRRRLRPAAAYLEPPPLPLPPLVADSLGLPRLPRLVVLASEALILRSPPAEASLIRLREAAFSVEALLRPRPAD